jgi:hypothetical protein
MAESKVLGPGVVYAITEGKLIIQVDLESNLGFTKKGVGDNVGLASSGGNKKIANGGDIIQVGLNVFREPTGEELAQHPIMGANPTHYLAADGKTVLPIGAAGAAPVAAGAIPILGTIAK